MPLTEKLVDFSTFQFVAHTINGKILEFPETYQLRCDLVIPLWQDVVKDYDKDGCIVSRRVYLISYDGNNLGTLDFTTMEEFVAYRNANCGINDIGCNVAFYGCPVTYNGCQITY
jgi:hypothetical protein